MKNILIISLLLLLVGCSKSIDGELIFVEPRLDDQFNYPYFLFIPNGVSEHNTNYLIIEPNNSGFADDDLHKHQEKAKRIATIDYYLGNWIARKLTYPLIVPVFPRTESDWKIYTHALDRDVMIQKGNSLERLDNQLINMCLDAEGKLKERNIKIENRYILTGFSASGTFVNRFTLLHPENVKAVVAGGLNGLLMVPLDSLENEPLRYPIGTGDLIQITGSCFLREQFLNTPQFYFMGELDYNDAVPYDDAFDLEERDQIFRLLGEQMMPTRWEKCIDLYNESKANVIFKTYSNTGHEHPEIVKNDILDFLLLNTSLN